MAEHIDYDEESKRRVWWLNKTGGDAASNLTVRDYFAAKAMSSYLGKIPLDVHVDVDGLAENAYALADAMMKERAK